MFIWALKFSKIDRYAQNVQVILSQYVIPQSSFNLELDGKIILIQSRYNFSVRIK